MRSAVAAVVALAVLVPGFAAEAPSASAGEGQRYVDPIFSVEVTPDLEYGSNVPLTGGSEPIDLELDLYEPAGDASRHRPVVIMVHGGGFCGGSRTSGRIVAQAEHMAARGWVTASISYRFTTEECDDLPSLVAATRDARAAVRWFRANADDLRVDPSRISMLGYSAGAFVTLGVAFGGWDGDSGNPGYSSRIAAGVSQAGFNLTPQPPSDVPPVQMAHGDEDTRVAFAQGVATCDRIRQVDGTCEMVVHEGVGHGPPVSTLEADATSFIHRCVASHAGFPDVPLGGSTDLEPAVGWMAGFGITQGYADGGYHPAAPVSRQAMSAFFYRLAGTPDFTPPATPTFDDVDLTHPFFAEVEWLASTGITQGYPDGGFRPSSSITRSAMATFLWRAAGEPATTTSGSFPDVPAGLPYTDPVEWMASTGITQGYADGLFRPANPVNRSQAAQFLWRLGRTGAPWNGPMEQPAASCTNADLTR